MVENTGSTRRRDRSPSYPLIPLEVAIERLTAFEAHFKRSGARPEKVGEAWGIKAKAYADRTRAALRYFGLLDYQGTGRDRQVVISEEGRKYLRAQQDEIRREVVKAAALRPKEIAKFWNEWGGDRPANAACLDDLVFEHGFSEAGAREFLKVYDATISFAGLSYSDKTPAEDTENGEDESEGNGDGDNHEEHTRAHRLHRTKRKERPGMKEDVFTLMEGDVVLQWPESLSVESFEDLEAWTKLILRKIQRHIILNEPVVGSMSTEYTDDEEGRQKEERDRKLDEEIDDNQD